MPVSPSQDDSRCLRTRGVTTAELTLDVGEKTVKTGGNDSESEQKEGRKKQILQSLCLLLASGFYGRRKVENLREIDEYP